jgi:hypothetical protein
LLDRVALPGYARHAVWLNFAGLHLLHRFPLHPVSSVGDFAGWANLSAWMTEDVAYVASTFPRVIISTPNQLCSSRFDEPDRLRWASALGATPDPSVVRACASHLVAANRSAAEQYCQQAAGIESGVQFLAGRFKHAAQHQVLRALNRLRPRPVCYGVLDTYAVTRTRCELTKVRRT